MEIEAKFVIPDQDAMLRLQRVVRLGPFVPGKAVEREMLDIYLDTQDHTLHENGYACRIRHRSDDRWLTIKGLGGVEQAIHSRFESEQMLPADATLDPETWPEGEGRSLVLGLVGEEPLLELMAVQQVRQVRPLHREERLVAALSLDQVDIRAGERRLDYQCLEAELTGEGEIDDVRALADHLSWTWGLEPELRSKFELGWALLEPEAAGESAAPTEGILPETVEQASEPPVLQPSAQEIERVPERSADEEGEQGLFEQELGPQAEAGGLEGLASEDVSVWIKDEMEASEESASATTVEELCERYQVDMAHARQVTETALLLFDRTKSIHLLGAERRRLLAAMAMLHNVGLEVDPDRHHVAGRDIVLENWLEAFTEMEQRMLAAAVYLHRKRMRRRKLEGNTVSSLPLGLRQDTLILAALVRMADGLDYSQSQSTSVQNASVHSATVQVEVAGPWAQVDAARAQSKADLWEMVFGETPFFFVVPGEESRRALHAGLEAEVEPSTGNQTALEQAMARKAPGISPDDPMWEAGRKVLFFHLARMLKHEPGTREGVDIEALHDMRVATRRMRSAFRTFAAYYEPRTIRPYVVGLRRTARTLGKVRDLDVFMQKARSYLDGLGPDHAGDLDVLLDAWQGQREESREAMIQVLDGSKYRDFVEAFRLFLESPGAGARRSDKIPPRPTLVRHVAPQLIYGRWASVQAFGPLLGEAPVSVLHALRIECKRLRYTLEFFSEVLAPAASQVIEAVVKLQDHLGDLNDADVANAMLSDFLFSSGTKGEGERLIAPGVVAYLAAKQRELQSLVETFPQAWETFNQPSTRQALADAVGVL